MWDQQYGLNNHNAVGDDTILGRYDWPGTIVKRFPYAFIIHLCGMISFSLGLPEKAVGWFS